jgi:hypothetical protein
MLAFTCLLRFDEVLKIQSHDIHIIQEGNMLEVTLPFRKTNQFGGEKYINRTGFGTLSDFVFSHQRSHPLCSTPCHMNWLTSAQSVPMRTG